MLKFSFIHDRHKRKIFLAWFMPVLIILCIAFRHQLYAAYVFATLDSESRKELSNMRILLREDGQYTGDEKYRNVYSINGFGNKFQTDISSSDYYQIPTSSPNNRSLVRRTNNKIGEHILVKFSGDKIFTKDLNIMFFEGHISSDGKYIAQLIKDKTINVYHEEELYRSINLDFRGYKIAWIPNSHSLVVREWQSGDGAGIYRLDIDTRKLTEVCRDDLWRLRSASDCSPTEEYKGMFGSSENPTNKLITFSPSQRFYYYFVAPDSNFIQYEWIEAYDTVKKRKWRVHKTYGFWDNFD